MPLIMMVLTFATKAATSVKVAYVAAGTLVLAVAGWSDALIVAAESSSSSAIDTAIPAGALTATAAALVWVVKQIAGGNLVHRDPATSEARLADMTEKLIKLTESSIAREAILHNILIRGVEKGDSK